MVQSLTITNHVSLHPCVPASLRVPGVDSDDETKTPSPSPHHGRSRPPSLIADSSSESDEGDARGEVRSFTFSLVLWSSLSHVPSVIGFARNTIHFSTT